MAVWLVGSRVLMVTKSYNMRMRPVVWTTVPTEHTRLVRPKCGLQKTRSMASEFSCWQSGHGHHWDCVFLLTLTRIAGQSRSMASSKIQMLSQEFKLNMPWCPAPYNQLGNLLVQQTERPMTKPGQCGKGADSQGNTFPAAKSQSGCSSIV